MEKQLKYIKLDGNTISEEQISQIVAVERSGGDDCYTEDQIRRIYVDDTKNVNFACVDNDKIIAHIATNPLSKRRNGSVFVINIVVAPEYRRQGIAQKLIQFACRYFIEKSVDLPMSISVDKDNIPAIKLYQKVGFEIKDPVCEMDEDDDQYILDSSLQNINQSIINIINKSELVE